MDTLNLNSLLFNPDLFFRDKLGNKISFKYPALVLLVYAAFAMGSSFLFMNMFKESFSSDPGSSGSSISFMVTLVGIVGGVIGGLIKNQWE